MLSKPNIEKSILVYRFHLPKVVRSSHNTLYRRFLSHFTSMTLLSFASKYLHVELSTFLTQIFEILDPSSDCNLVMYSLRQVIFTMFVSISVYLSSLHPFAALSNEAADEDQVATVWSMMAWGTRYTKPSQPQFHDAAGANRTKRAETY